MHDLQCGVFDIKDTKAFVKRNKKRIPVQKPEK